MGEATTRTPSGLGPSNWSKKMAQWVNLIAKSCFLNFQGWTPTPQHFSGAFPRGLPPFPVRKYPHVLCIPTHVMYTNTFYVYPHILCIPYTFYVYTLIIKLQEAAEEMDAVFKKEFEEIIGCLELLSAKGNCILNFINLIGLFIFTNLRSRATALILRGPNYSP